MTGSRAEIGTSPQGRHAMQEWKLLPQDTAGFAFEAPHDLIGCPLRRCRNEQMEMIGQDFERQYLALQKGCSLADEFFEPRFDTIYQHLAPPLGTPDDVVVHEKDARLFGSIALFHG